MARFGPIARAYHPELERASRVRGTMEYITVALFMAMAAFLMGQLGWWFPGGSTLGSWLWLLVWALMAWAVYCAVKWWRVSPFEKKDRVAVLVPYLLLAAFMVVCLWLSFTIMLASHQAEFFAAWLIGNDNMQQFGVLRYAHEINYTDTGRIPLNFDFLTVNSGLFAIYLVGAFAYLELYYMLGSPMQLAAVQEVTLANVWKSIGKRALIAVVCIIVATVAIMPSIGWSTIIVSGL